MTLRKQNLALSLPGPAQSLLTAMRKSLNHSGYTRTSDFQAHVPSNINLPTALRSLASAGAIVPDTNGSYYINAGYR